MLLPLLREGRVNNCGYEEGTATRVLRKGKLVVYIGILLWFFLFPSITYWLGPFSLWEPVVDLARFWPIGFQELTEYVAGFYFLHLLLLPVSPKKPE